MTTPARAVTNIASPFMLSASFCKPNWPCTKPTSLSSLSSERARSTPNVLMVSTAVASSMRCDESTAALSIVARDFRLAAGWCSMTPATSSGTNAVATIASWTSWTQSNANISSTMTPSTTVVVVAPLTASRTLPASWTRDRMSPTRRVSKKLIGSARTWRM